MLATSDTQLMEEVSCLLRDEDNRVHSSAPHSPADTPMNSPSQHGSSPLTLTANIVMTAADYPSSVETSASSLRDDGANQQDAMDEEVTQPLEILSHAPHEGSQYALPQVETHRTSPPNPVGGPPALDAQSLSVASRSHVQRESQIDTNAAAAVYGKQLDTNAAAAVCGTQIHTNAAAAVCGTQLETNAAAAACGTQLPMMASAASRRSAPQLTQAPSSADRPKGKGSMASDAPLVTHDSAGRFTSAGEKEHPVSNAPRSIFDLMDLPRGATAEDLPVDSQPCVSDVLPSDVHQAENSAAAGAGIVSVVGASRSAASPVPCEPVSSPRKRRSAFSYFDDVLRDEDPL